MNTENHRIAIEPRSGIWLMFYETLHSQFRGLYRQQLLRIFKEFDTAEKVALFQISDRQISSPLIVRDDSQKNVMLRG